MFDTYAGHFQRKTECITQHSLNWTRQRIGSQCNCNRHGVTCSRVLSSKIKRAAEFCTRCNLLFTSYDSIKTLPVFCWQRFQSVQTLTNLYLYAVSLNVDVGLCHGVFPESRLLVSTIILSLFERSFSIRISYCIVWIMEYKCCAYFTVGKSRCQYGKFFQPGRWFLSRL